MPEPTDPAGPADFELAHGALLDLTSAETIGEPAGSIDEGQGTVTLHFDSKKVGYPGWRWTVSIAHVEGSEPTVLETELTPGDDALLAPDWVPWVDRLAEYEAAQQAEAEAEAGGPDDEADDDDESDDDESDDDFYDDDADDDDPALLHGGDLDGVDIDEIAPDADDENADDENADDENADDEDEDDEDEDDEDEDDEDEDD